MDTFIFHTKGRKRKKIKAENHIEACEKFKEQTPDFHLSELIDIESVKSKKDNRKEWANMHKAHKRTNNDPKSI